MSDKWDKRFMDLADTVASWSKDPSTKVGCVLVNSMNIVIGMGYNGFPRYVEDCEERYANREMKYKMVIHAEANAILNSVGNVDDCTAYVTHPPCADCTGLLIQAGILKIVTREPNEGLKERFKESFEISNIMLDESLVDLIYV